MPSALLVATAIIYAILIQPISYCTWKHGKPGLLGFMVVLTFCVIRIVGSVLQIGDEKSGTTTTATLVIANIGLSPMILGVAGILHEARTIRDPTINIKIEWAKVIAFHMQVMLSMVFVIVGITQQISDKKSHATPLMKVGVLLLLLCEVILAFWTWRSFIQVRRTHLLAWDDATLLLKTVVLSLPYVLLRTLYSVIVTFSPNTNFKNNTAAKVCLSVMPEMLLVVLVAVNGIRTRNILAKRKIEGVEQGTPAIRQEYPLLDTSLKR